MHFTEDIVDELVGVIGMVDDGNGSTLNDIVNVLENLHGPVRRDVIHDGLRAAISCGLIDCHNCRFKICKKRNTLMKNSLFDIAGCSSFGAGLLRDSNSRESVLSMFSLTEQDNQYLRGETSCSSSENSATPSLKSIQSSDQLSFISDSWDTESEDTVIYSKPKKKGRKVQKSPLFKLCMQDSNAKKSSDKLDESNQEIDKENQTQESLPNESENSLSKNRNSTLASKVSVCGIMNEVMKRFFQPKNTNSYIEYNKGVLSKDESENGSKPHVDDLSKVKTEIMKNVDTFEKSESIEVPDSSRKYAEENRGGINFTVENMQQRIYNEVLDKCNTSLCNDESNNKADNRRNGAELPDISSCSPIISKISKSGKTGKKANQENERNHNNDQSYDKDGNKKVEAESPDIKCCSSITEIPKSRKRGKKAKQENESKDKNDESCGSELPDISSCSSVTKISKSRKRGKKVNQVNECKDSNDESFDKADNRIVGSELQDISSCSSMTKISKSRKRGKKAKQENASNNNNDDSCDETGNRIVGSGLPDIQCCSSINKIPKSRKRGKKYDQENESTDNRIVGSELPDISSCSSVTKISKSRKRGKKAKQENGSNNNNDDSCDETGNRIVGSEFPDNQCCSSIIKIPKTRKRGKKAQQEDERNDNDESCNKADNRICEEELPVIPQCSFNTKSSNSGQKANLENETNDNVDSCQYSTHSRVKPYNSRRPRVQSPTESHSSKRAKLS